MRSYHSHVILLLLTFAVLLPAALPALAQFRGRGDDRYRFREEWRSRDRDFDDDDGDDRDSSEERRRWDSDEDPPRWDRRRWDEDEDQDEDEDDSGGGGDSRYGRGDFGRSFGGRSFGGSDGSRIGRGRFGSSGDSDSDAREPFRPSPEDFFNRIDDNGNGVIDGDEMEGRAGMFLERAGIKEGASRQEFSEGFERLRDAGGAGSPGEAGRSDSDERAQVENPQGFTPSDRERVTYELPAAYLDRDPNGDGQIALHEWRDWDWTTIDEFHFLDGNGDGFVTPREMIAVTGPPAEVAPPTGSANVANPTPPRTTPVTLDENDPNVRRGRQFFRALDLDQDGTASAAELGLLNKQRPMFERAGIRLDQPMTADEFTANYARAASQ